MAVTCSECIFYHKPVNPVVYSGSDAWVMMNAYIQQLDEENNK